jgi:hypothetical protein
VKILCLYFFLCIYCKCIYCVAVRGTSAANGTGMLPRIRWGNYGAHANDSFNRFLVDGCEHHVHVAAFLSACAVMPCPSKFCGRVQEGGAEPAHRIPTSLPGMCSALVWRAFNSEAGHRLWRFRTTAAPFRLFRCRVRQAPAPP